MLHTKAIFFLGGRRGTESSGLRNAIYRHTFQTNVFLDQAFLKTNVNQISPLDRLIFVLLLLFRGVFVSERRNFGGPGFSVFMEFHYT